MSNIDIIAKRVQLIRNNMNVNSSVYCPSGVGCARVTTGYYCIHTGIDAGAGSY